MRSAQVRRSREVIRRLDPHLRACILVRHEADGPGPGPLHGWTMAVKDNMDVAGTVRTDGLAPPHPPPAERDSEVVRRLHAAGAVVVAKANLEELSFGATTQNAWWGRCRNPWDVSRLPGGSSGGSAVAVACGMVDAALGTDTGGSVRNPAAFCGISGLRPSVGWIPMDGVTPLSPDYDVVGPMARAVSELRALLAVLADRRPPARRGLDGLRVGIPETFFYDDLDPAVTAGCDAIRAVLTAAGARLLPVGLRDAATTPDALAILLNAQAAETHPALLDDERIAAQVRDRLSLGRRASARERAAAREVAMRWERELADAFERVDILLVPTTPMPAPPIDGEHMVTVSRQINRLTAPWSLARLPALALPCGNDAGGLPVGAQLVGPRDADWLLLDAGAAIQARSDWHERRPATGRWHHDRSAG
jgi:aspartyl-tRNA(Asn)/glutamyl-tRNA(Gln) amidotransferase subunit A